MAAEIKYPPHFSFSNLPTPIEWIEDGAGKKILIKRDDMTGIELSGNKIRKLDFLLKDAVDKGADHIITCGGIQSNHCRATALAAARLGVKCTLMLRGGLPQDLNGNILLSMMAGADVHSITPEQYRSVEELMSALGRGSDRSGMQSYIIPEGGSNPCGAWGYVRAFEEIVRQLDAMKEKVDIIVTATGSGGTHAGLLIGRQLMNRNERIVSVNVCDDAAFFKDKIRRIITGFASSYNYPISVVPDEIEIIDGFVGEGYGRIDSGIAGLIGSVSRNNGIILDPVYGAKAFAGMIDRISSGDWRRERLLFIHTGGIFGIYPYAGQLV